jgi:uncharacterized protein (TIGR00645 family)
VIKPSFEKILLASRWLLAPFYIALIFALLALLGKVGTRVYDLATQFFGLNEEAVLLSALGVVDLTLEASLIVIVIISGYANFVSRIDSSDHRGWPHWIADIDFSELKVKLLASIVAISDRALGWQTGILVTFVACALLLALADRIGNRPNGEP